MTDPIAVQAAAETAVALIQAALIAFIAAAVLVGFKGEPK